MQATVVNGQTLSNQVARGTQLAVMLCPSDTYNRKPFNGSSTSSASGMGDGWARGDYGANASLDMLGGGGTTADTAAQWRSRYTQGVMGADVSCRIDDIKDGTKQPHDHALGEIRAGVVPCDDRGCWAMSGGCPSSLWACGYYGDDNFDLIRPSRSRH